MEMMEIYNDALNDYKKVCNSCTIYIALFIIFFIISIDILDRHITSSTYFYLHWYLKKGNIETAIY